MMFNRYLNIAKLHLAPTVIFVFFTFILFGTLNSIYPQVSSETNKIKSSENYRIGVGDILKVVVTKQELLSLDGVRVNNDGNIRMPMLDEDIPAACLTETELSSVITEKYQRYLVNPQVYVAVQEFKSNPVAFIGAVNAPGRFDVRRPTRLLELLAFVNGPSKEAGEHIQIIRRLDMEQCVDNKMVKPIGEDDQEIIQVALDQTLKGETKANPYVQAGDIITIDEAIAPEKAYIIGNIKTPREIVLDDTITLTKAIAMAGGVSQGAKIKKILIRRQDPKTLDKTEIPVNLEDINDGKQKDIILQPNDIVDIPGPKPSLLKDIFRNIIPGLTRFPLPIL